MAALNIAAGVVVIRHPEGSAGALTMFAALLFDGLGPIAIGVGGRRIVRRVTPTPMSSVPVERSETAPDQSNN